MTIEEIEILSRQQDRESLKIELKSFEKLVRLNHDNKKDIAAEIVALANRQGGKLIFGMNDDGSFNGKIPDEIDKVKELIQNICNDSISPVIEITFQFIEGQENDVLIVYIPKRKGMPHAVVEKSGAHIKKRIYYVRTSHGKTLVTDGQLQWMFAENGEPKYRDQFQIVFQFDKHWNLSDGIIATGNFGVVRFLDQLPLAQRDLMGQDNNALQSFFIEIMPYLFLYSIAGMFTNSWQISKNDQFDRRSYGHKKLPDNETSLIDVEDIPVTGESFIRRYGWDFKKLLSDSFERPFHIPAGTEINIHYDGEYANARRSKILMKNDGFEIEINFTLQGWGTGLHPKSVISEIYSDLMGDGFHNYSINNYIHVDAVWFITADLKFPDYDMSNYEAYKNYYEALKGLIDSEWNYETRRRKHPPKETLIINEKLNQLLDSRNSSNNSRS